jgi:hypothetical protein
MVFVPEVFKRNEDHAPEQGMEEEIKVGSGNFCFFHQVRPVFCELGLDIIRGEEGEGIVQENLSRTGIPEETDDPVGIYDKFHQALPWSCS